MQLLEREHLLAALTDYAREARAGEGRLVLVSGEAGIGKSALVEGFAAQYGAARWVSGACDGLFTPRPLGPLFDIAEQLGGELLDACRIDVSRDTLFALLLKQLHDPGELTVVCIEDVHWADESTLDLLRFLGRRMRSIAALLIVTYRDDALAADDSLRIVVGELGTDRATRRVSVPRLSERAVATLAEFGDADPGEVYRLTGGNPFFVTEMIQRGAAGLPTSARDAVLSRVARLSSAAQHAIEVAALVGTKVDPQVLDGCAVAPRGLDELVGSGVLLSTADTLRFRHEITRLAVEENIPAHRRVVIHAQLLESLRRAGVTDEARLAFHADGAGDRRAVLQYAPSAGARASALGAHREAAAQYERALRHAGGSEPILLARLYDCLARESSLIDRWEMVADAAGHALELWRDIGDRARQSATAVLLTRTMWRLCRGAESHAYATFAVTTAATLGPSPELARALVAMAAAHMHSGDDELALERVRRAVELAEQLDLADVLSDGLDTEACVLFLQRRDWSPTMLRALQVALAADVVDQAGRAYANLTELHYTVNDFVQADAFFAEGVLYCDEHDVATFGTCLRSVHAKSLFDRGHWRRAADMCRKLLATGASPSNRMMPLWTLGRILARRGDHEAWQVIDEAVSIADQSGDPELVGKSYLVRAEAHWLDGRIDDAVRDIDVAAAIATVTDAWTRGDIASWQRRLAALETEVGDGLAEPYARQLKNEFRAATKMWDDLNRPYEAAITLLDSGADASLREALERFEALGADAATTLTRKEMRRRGMRAVPTGAHRTTRSHPAGLTRREREVLDLICAGHTNGEISELLVISSARSIITCQPCWPSSPSGLASRPRPKRSAVVSPRSPRADVSRNLGTSERKVGGRHRSAPMCKFIGSQRQSVGYTRNEGASCASLHGHPHDRRRRHGRCRRAGPPGRPHEAG